jgi:hypothetical protein
VTRITASSLLLGYNPTSRSFRRVIIEIHGEEAMNLRSIVLSRLAAAALALPLPATAGDNAAYPAPVATRRLDALIYSK